MSGTRTRMSTQLRNCLVRCGGSGFAVDYWGHRDFVGARPEPVHHLPARPVPSPIFTQTRKSPSETLLGTPRSPVPFASLVRPFRRAFPDPRAQRPSRRPKERMAFPDRREDLLHRHHQGAHPSQVPQTPGHLDRDPRAGPTHRRRPRRHRRAPHGDRDRRRSLSG